jgi:SAM-dependent methyltransferase
VTFNEDWEQEAENWIGWARKPGHDAYWLYRDAFFELLPPPGRATLDVGCGEGRVTRDLTARGHRVVAVDASPTLVRAASQADAEGEYLVADAAALPFDDASFDLVVAYNSLMDVQDMPGAVREAARVLQTGRLVLQRGPDEAFGCVEEAARQPDRVEVVVGARRDAGIVELVDPRVGTGQQDRGVRRDDELRCRAGGADDDGEQRERSADRQRGLRLVEDVEALTGEPVCGKREEGLAVRLLVQR